MHFAFMVALGQHITNHSHLVSCAVQSQAGEPPNSAAATPQAALKATWEGPLAQRCSLPFSVISVSHPLSAFCIDPITVVSAAMGALLMSSSCLCVGFQSCKNRVLPMLKSLQSSCNSLKPVWVAVDNSTLFHLAYLLHSEVVRP